MECEAPEAQVNEKVWLLRAQEAPNMAPDASKIELGEPRNKFVRDASFFRMFFDMLLYFLIFV